MACRCVSGFSEGLGSSSSDLVTLNFSKAFINCFDLSIAVDSPTSNDRFRHENQDNKDSVGEKR